MVEYAGEVHEIEPVLAQGRRNRRTVAYIEIGKIFDLMLVSQYFPGQIEPGSSFDDVAGNDRLPSSLLQYEGHKPIHGADVDHAASFQIDMFEERIYAE